MLIVNHYTLILWTASDIPAFLVGAHLRQLCLFFFLLLLLLLVLVLELVWLLVVGCWLFIVCFLLYLPVGGFPQHGNCNTHLWGLKGFGPFPSLPQGLQPSAVASTAGRNQPMSHCGSEAAKVAIAKICQKKIPSGNQSWLAGRSTWRGFHGKIVYKWDMFHCHRRVNVNIICSPNSWSYEMFLCQNKVAGPAVTRGSVSWLLALALSARR